MKKSTFYDFLNRHADDDFESFINRAKEDVDYINWHDFCLPMAYADTAAEYKAVRSTCALFDASPVKKYQFTGIDAGAFLDAVMTRPMSRKKSMHAGYAVFCNEDGMLRDDGLLYKFAEDNYLLMVSELDHDEYFEQLVDGRFLGCPGQHDCIVPGSRIKMTPARFGCCVGRGIRCCGCGNCIRNCGQSEHHTCYQCPTNRICAVHGFLPFLLSGAWD